MSLIQFPLPIGDAFGMGRLWLPLSLDPVSVTLSYNLATSVNSALIVRHSAPIVEIPQQSAALSAIEPVNRSFTFLSAASRPLTNIKNGGAVGISARTSLRWRGRSGAAWLQMQSQVARARQHQTQPPHRAASREPAVSMGAAPTAALVLGGE